jgi:uncharacterized coiled-coil protein SlyX
MADKGPGSSSLIQLRIKAEIARLESTLATQALQIAEKEEEINRLHDNIAATRKEIEKQQGNLDAQLKLTQGGEN